MVIYAVFAIMNVILNGYKLYSEVKKYDSRFVFIV